MYFKCYNSHLQSIIIQNPYEKILMMATYIRISLYWKLFDNILVHLKVLYN